MKHIFIINPAAGKKNCTTELMEMAKKLEINHGIETECILTKSVGHACETVRSIAQTGESVRFYACGGDGTINEVANGIAGFENAAMTCIPVGTGNDFLKNFGDKAELFADAENLWDGPQFSLDAIECNGRLALTIACSGFDAQVAEDVHKFGKSPLLSGMGSYVASIAVNFFARSFGNRWKVSVSGRDLSGDYAVLAVCNGRYYGGGFNPVAEARMDDGMLNALLVKKISRPQFLRFVSLYAKGEYYKLPDFATCIPTREVTIESADDRDIVTCLDGEIIHSKHITMCLSDRKINFFGPAGCDANATYRPLP